MPRDYFSWVAQQPGDKLTRKINEEISEAEEDDYRLEDKEILKHPDNGDTGEAIILLHFRESKHKETDQGNFIEPIDVSVGEFDEDMDIDKGRVIGEKIAETTHDIRGHYPDHQVMDMELDEDEKILYLQFEPL